MTLPDEKIRALQLTRDFLRDLQDRTKTKSVTRIIRDRAYSCLRHFPWSTDDEVILKALEGKCP